ncbi:divergent polysaccharide deacetylase family protein [Reyranella sp.]|uniref:divergent polysaccharide deacetylase family protein n=1 Tax=Reyranella sp. TaxID=1929291 RepID=UPI0025F86B8D|nr:divergent polysaccharide deacetylase family protein [Reyranella sp.]
MASRKNRSGKANRRSPKPPPGLGERLRARFGALLSWIEAHRWHSIIVAVVLMFVGSLFGGYWLAQRFDLTDRDRLARDTLEDMKRGGSSATRESEPKYARLEDLPDFPKYSEAEPGKPRATLGEKPRPAPAKPQQVAAAASAEQTWRRNALPFRDLNSRPLIAIVIDDVGLDRPRSRRAWELPGPMTMSFLPYAKDLREQAKAARAKGHELMLHLPMEPNGRNDPGPNALLVSLSDAELRQRTNTALDSFDGFVGVNNHMGSRFTAFRPGMETVMRQFKTRGVMFLDSRTTAQSVGDQTAHEQGVPSIVRHVFLDDEETLDAVRRKLAETEAVARRQGFAVAIGHPHDVTLQALAEWLPTVQSKGLALAPSSAVLRKRNGWD